MIHNILKNTGIPYKETRFNKAPSTTYLIFTDSVVRQGADNRNLLYYHHVFIELYSSSIDFESEKKLENQLDTYAIQYNKSERVWLDNEQKYQIIYDFNYLEKEGGR